MIRTGTCLTICASATLLCLAGVIWGFSSGAPGAPGSSGGRVANGHNCTGCHEPFHVGTGRVELIGVPRRYRANETYDVTVRVIAPDEDGASFALSAENDTGFSGSLLLVPDDVRTCQGGTSAGDLCTIDADCPSGTCADDSATKFTPGIPDYVTHTHPGALKSVIEWTASGGQYDFRVRWKAPAIDDGLVTLFVAANGIVSTDDVIDDFQGFDDVRYYAGYEVSRYGMTGDGDGDGDIDLADMAAFQRCMSDTLLAECAFLDADNDTVVSVVDYSLLINDPAFSDVPAAVPAGFVLADPVRGGLLYDKWWMVNRAAAPSGDHPLYPVAGLKTGSTTFRCKECHGWDYRGVDGAYGSGSHFTGIGGVFGTQRTPQRVFDLLTSGVVAGGGHDMATYGMTERDLWDVVKFVFDGVVDTDLYIDGAGQFIGSQIEGQLEYDQPHCVTCHGAFGDHLDFDPGAAEVFLGTVANANPWEFLHKTRFGHPGSAMPSTDLLNWTVQTSADVGVHAQTMPQ